MLTPTCVMVTTTAPTLAHPVPEPLASASLVPPVIEIWSFLPSPHHPYSPQQPLRAQAEDETSYRPRLLQTLRLPAFADGAVITTFDVRPDPAFPPPHSARAADAAAPRLGHKAFTQDPAKGVLVLELHVLEPPEADPAMQGLDAMESHSYELFVLRETLVQLARDGEARLRASWDALRGYDDGSGRYMVDQTLAWEQWGEKGARLMHAAMRNRTWVCSCSGYRFVSLIPSALARERAAPRQPGHNLVDPPAQPSDLRVLDFSPAGVARALQRRRRRRRASASPEPFAPLSRAHRLSITSRRSDADWHDRWAVRAAERIADRLDLAPMRAFGQAPLRWAPGRMSVFDIVDGMGFAPAAARERHEVAEADFVGADDDDEDSDDDDDDMDTDDSDELDGGDGLERHSRPAARDPLGGSAGAGKRVHAARVVDWPTTIPARRVWAGDVRSGLPYREVVRVMEIRANGVMMDDQRIIMISSTGRRNGDWTDIRQEMTVLCM